MHFLLNKKVPSHFIDEEAVVQNAYKWLPRFYNAEHLDSDD